MRAVCLFCGCGERILAVRGTGWGPPSQEGGAPRFALGRRTPQGSLLTPAGAELRDSRLAGQRWPGPARSEKLRLLRGAVGAAQVLGTTVLGTHREKGSSQGGGAGCTVARASYERPNSAPRRLSHGWGGGCAEPEPAWRERPESAGHPPRLPAWGPGGGSPPRGCPHSKQPGCCRHGEKQIDPTSRSKFSPSPRPGSSAAERAGPWTFLRHRPPAPGLPPDEFSPAQGKALSQRTGTVRGPVGDTRKVGSVSARLRQLGEGSLKTGGAGQQRAQGAAHHGARGRCAEETEQRGWP